MPARRLDDVIDTLRAKGRRVTTPRREILRALIEHPEHPTAEQLTAEVQARQPDVNASTVYRFLDDLERQGIVDHVHLGHGPAVYHFTDDTHHHLICETCGRVTQVPQQTFDTLREQLRDDYHFEMEPHHFALPGRCQTCAQSSSPRPS
ncbi:MAG: Fur family transcriptional regulator [Acidimicrobiales bacterium]